jgi:Sigma-54 interaction domain
METNTDTDRRPSGLRMNGRLPATVDHDADDTPAGLGRARCVPVTPMLDRRSGTSPVAAPPPDERVHGSRVVALRPRGGKPSPMGLPVDDGGAAADFEELIGVSAAFKRAMRQVAQVGPTDASVLITGETGTGKELIARRLHACSARPQRPLVVVNCAALPTTLVESELFGHERGAFTGAVQRKPGRFELADGGTIFLDEIGELPLESQAKLLRVLEEREFERVGGTGPVRVDVRMIAATNQPLETRVAEGAFRADLFYRLDVYRLALPPLRDRAEDIWLLADISCDAAARASTSPSARSTPSRWSGCSTTAGPGTSGSSGTPSSARCCSARPRCSRSSCRLPPRPPEKRPEGPGRRRGMGGKA